MLVPHPFHSVEYVLVLLLCLEILCYSSICYLSFVKVKWCTLLEELDPPYVHKIIGFLYRRADTNATCLIKKCNKQSFLIRYINRVAKLLYSLYTLQRIKKLQV